MKQHVLSTNYVQGTLLDDTKDTKIDEMHSLPPSADERPQGHAIVPSFLSRIMLPRTGAAGDDRWLLPWTADHVRRHHLPFSLTASTYHTAAM